MFDTSDLKAAQKAGVLSQEQYSRLTIFLENRQHAETSGADESLRFLANFNDIFITIGIVILAIGLTAMTGTFFAPMASSLASSGSLTSLGALVLLPVAGVMWLLSEYFCGRRRLLLPSMALTLIMSVYVGLSVGMLASGLTGANMETVESFFDAWNMLGNAGIATFLGIVATGLAVYLRFRLPFALFVVAVAGAAAVYTFAGFFGNIGMILGGMAFFLIGGVTLTLAIMFDASDPARMTRRSDNAFWLHVAAAPQLIWGLRSLIVGSGVGMPNAVEAALIIIVLAAMAALSLALNRRALIVSGLLTFAMALGRLVEATGGGVTTTLVTTTLLLGTGILLLGGGWHTARRGILHYIPKSPLADRLFPREAA